MKEVVLTTGAIRRAKLRPTNHHLAFYRPDALFVTSPTVSEHWREKYRNSIDLLTPGSPGRGLATLSLTTKGFWSPCNRVDKPALDCEKQLILNFKL